MRAAGVSRSTMMRRAIASCAFTALSAECLVHGTRKWRGLLTGGRVALCGRRNWMAGWRCSFLGPEANKKAQHHQRPEADEFGPLRRMEVENVRLMLQIGWTNGRLVRGDFENPIPLEPFFIAVGPFQSMLFKILERRLQADTLYAAIEPGGLVKAPVGVKSPIKEQLEADHDHEQVGGDFKTRKPL